MPSNNVRDIFFNAIIDNMEAKDLFVLNADMVGRPFIDISRKYPDRYVQVGIAEQNMIAVATGLALDGRLPVTFSPSPFVYLRALDQLRNAICAMNLKVIMISNGMGFVNPGLGVTHFPTECYNIISLCPGLEYCAVSDEAVARSAAGYILGDLKRSMFICLDYLCDGEIECDDTVDMGKGYRFIKKTPDKGTV